MTSPMCGVCGGSGKPTSGLPCICGGAGTEAAELHGLRVECFRLEDELERLRASQITAEEAAWLLDYHICNPATDTAFEYPDAYQNSAVAKLCLISSSVHVRGPLVAPVQTPTG
jgi:hypothetical protein